MWDRYGPEIDAEIAGVPPWQRSIELYQKASEVVQGRHWRDFVAEEAQRLAGSQSPLERGSGSPAPGMASVPSDPIDALLADHDSVAVKRMRSQGLGPGDVRSLYVGQMGLTPEQAADYVKNSRTLNAQTPAWVERGINPNA